MAKRIRLFVALPIDKHWEKVFEHYRDPLGSIPWLTFEPLNKLHVTALFIGAVDEDLVPEIMDVFRDVAQVQTPFTLTLDRITYAPEGKRASMVWARWRDHKLYTALASLLREEITLLTGDLEALPAIPHTTLARFKRTVAPPTELIHLKQTEHEGEELSVKTILLMESVMTTNGSLYKPIAKCDLGENSAPEIHSVTGE